MKKTEVASNPEEYGYYWENIGGGWVKKKYKIGSVGDDNQKNNLNEEYERFEFKGGIC